MGVLDLEILWQVVVNDLHVIDAHKVDSSGKCRSPEAALLLCRNGIDLNRDFPDPILLGEDNLAATGTEQPETLAVMQWIKKTHFVASASMHEVNLFSLMRYSALMGSVRYI